MKAPSITIRVYGLLIENNRILLSKENIKGEIHTKFPGGGLEAGEGILDCLRREFMEETGIEIQNIQHFYTTEDFFLSGFHAEPTQVISIYYKVRSKETDKIRIEAPEKEFLLKKDEDQILYWKDLHELKQEKIELPIDKIVVQLITSQ